jgi:N6-L-threonylcarbamoyladenine synthase
MAAKTLAMVGNKPLLGINHLEGHALTARLTDDVAFPYLLLLVSGGHCQWLLVRGVGDYVLLGETQDDAVGEAFDKCAKMLGLPYPGGPSVEKAALQGNPDTLDLPMPLCNRPGCDMSFSGLKTALMRHIMQLNHGHQLPESTVADVCASFQATVGRILANRLRHAMAMAREMEPSVAQLVVAGGVAANRYLRTILAAEADKAGWVMVAPPLAYCTDNAAMIAWAGLERFRCGAADSLALTPRARWPLSSAVLLASNG